MASQSSCFIHTWQSLLLLKRKFGWTKSVLIYYSALGSLTFLEKVEREKDLRFSTKKKTLPSMIRWDTNIRFTTRVNHFPSAGWQHCPGLSISGRVQCGNDLIRRSIGVCWLDETGFSCWPLLLVILKFLLSGLAQKSESISFYFLHISS